VHVSLRVPPEHALIALLHDAPEAYAKDIPRPLKRLLERVYSPIEARVWAAIAGQFGLPLELPETVKRADELVLAAEIRDLIRPSDLRDEALAMLPMPADVLRIEPLDWWESEQLFLARFRELRGQHRLHHWTVLG
jgi:5'-deoxynucleotidase YfbR-like HD superfamily hydrolase